jgi:hypothetical protein
MTPKAVRAVIVLDCKRASIRPVALAALTEELPTTVQVVLWGAGKRPTLSIGPLISQRQHLAKLQ